MRSTLPGVAGHRFQEVRINRIMSRRTAGIPCPECNHDDMTILEWVNDADGFLTGMRLLCMKCEHPWDYSTEDKVRQKEIELTPEIKKWVQEAIDASSHDVDFDLVCYYIRFGIDAPQPPKLSEEGRAWLKQLKESASS